MLSRCTDGPLNWSEPKSFTHVDKLNKSGLTKLEEKRPDLIL